MFHNINILNNKYNQSDNSNCLLKAHKNMYNKVPQVKNNIFFFFEGMFKLQNRSEIVLTIWTKCII